MALPASCPGIPSLEHGRDGVEPWHLHGAAGLQHHDGTRVGGSDGGDELVLAAGEADVLEVAPLGVPLAVAADEDQRDLGGAGGLDGCRDRCVAERQAEADAECGEGHQLRRTGRELDDDLDRLAGDEVDGADDLVAAFLEEGAARGPAGPGVGDQPAVDEHAGQPGGEHADPVRAGGLGHEAAGKADRVVAGVDLAAADVGAEPEGLRLV